MKIQFVFCDADEDPTAAPGGWRWFAIAVGPATPPQPQGRLIYSHQAKGPKRTRAQAKKTKARVQCYQRSTEAHGAVLRSLNESDDAETFAEFRANFIRGFQRLAVDCAAETGAIMAPTNFVEEFWTPEHVARLHEAFRRPRMTISTRMLKFLLFADWEYLRGLDRKQLAQYVNSSLRTQYKPGTVWQTAYRMGLFSKRPSGPRPR